MGFFCFFEKVCITINTNVPLRTDFLHPIDIGTLCFHVICLKKFLISSLINWLFSNRLLRLHIFSHFYFCSSFLVSYICDWTKSLIWFFILKLLKHVLWSSMWFILYNISCAIEKNVYSAVWDITSFKYIAYYVI